MTDVFIKRCSNNPEKPCNDCCGCLSPLPDGSSCADCSHARRCTTIFGQKLTDIVCQFIPSRWVRRLDVSK